MADACAAGAPAGELEPAPPPPPADPPQPPPPRLHLPLPRSTGNGDPMDMAAAAACAGEKAPSLPAAMTNPVPPACLVAIPEALPLPWCSVHTLSPSGRRCCYLGAACCYLETNAQVHFLLASTYVNLCSKYKVLVVHT